VANWYLAPSLSVLRSEVNTRWPGRDHTSDGTIGDDNHQASHSDHNPNIRDSVDAWDMDRDGVDVAAVIAAFQRHPSANYWIFNREIADVDDGWRRRAYTGPNAHTLHVHFSIKQTSAAEQDRRSWGLLEGLDMNDLQDKRLHALDSRLASTVAGQDSTKTAWSDANPLGSEQNWLVRQVKLAQSKLDASDLKLAALAVAIGNVDEATAAQLKTRFDAVDAALVASAQRDAALQALLEQHAAGQLDAETVVRRMGELLSAATSE
jgi:hypothetical protein